MVAVKVDVSDLMTGMFVSKLDRPWTETSFLLEGVLIESEDDIEEFQRICEYVFVDRERCHESIIPNLQLIAERSKTSELNSRQHELVYTAEMAEQDQKDFRQELKHARKIKTSTRQYIDQALEDVRLGNSLDTAKAKELVTSIAESVTRSPNAMLWLTHMKNRDEYTSIHCMNVCVLALTFGRFVGLNNQELNTLGLGALLHDVGKMSVPLEILNKPGRLNDSELDIIRTHSLEGYNMLSEEGNIDDDVLEIVLSHHERIDGSGYPRGLSGEFIDRLTQITSIVDVYDAITSDRCYHDGMPPYEAMKKMYAWGGGNFEPDLIESFIKCLGIYPIGSLVKLNTGHIGVVVSTTEKARLRPIILIVIDVNGQRLDIPKILNLAHPQWRRGEKTMEIECIVDDSDYDFDLPTLVANPSVL